MTSAFETVADLVANLYNIVETDQLARCYCKTFPHPGGPYGKQEKFHAAGRENRQRALISGNQTGKSRTIAAEISMHLTGRYPDWWVGKRFDKPVIACVCGVTNEEIRNIVQAQLFGEVVEEDGKKSLSGTGWVPKDCIGAFSFRQCGVTNVLDLVSVKHVSGKKSLVMLKSYEQGVLKFQGFEADIMWFDEEPESEGIFSEALTRLAAREGIFLFSRTPLFGMSKLIQHFTELKPLGTWWIGATWDDSPHLSDQIKKELAASYPQHERETRVKGVPMMGVGAVYPIPDELILCEPIPIPPHWRRICGIDFGIDHPAAAAWLAYDADSDVLYLYDCYKRSNETTAYHVQAINAHGDWIPVAWPQDGIQRDKGSGISLSEQYRSRGANMLFEHAQWEVPEKGQSAVSREAGAIDLLERMLTGRFKVFNTPACAEFLAEKRMLHRKVIPGRGSQIVAVDDDIESAVRYALMMLRYAVSRSVAQMKNFPQQQDTYDPLENFSCRR